MIRRSNAGKRCIFVSPKQPYEHAPEAENPGSGNNEARNHVHTVRVQSFRRLQSHSPEWAGKTFHGAIMKASQISSHRFSRQCLLFAVLGGAWFCPGAYAANESANVPSPTTQESPTNDVTIPPGTILPVRLNSLSSEKNKPGDVIKARIMQDVPLENGRKLRVGSSVLGRVVDVQSASSGRATLAIEFDSVVHGKERIPVRTHLRAVASTLEVEFAQIPPIGPSESDVYDWLPTTQIGGEVVYGKGGEVTNGDRVVGRSVNDGILAQPGSKEGSECRGPVEGNDRPQAFWVFSSDACGVYGFSKLTIGQTGRTDPQGKIVLGSEHGPVKIRSGSGMLLRVQE